ncbi:MAG: sugar ABC transporter permease YjfF [Ruminococcus sp.]|nr:sugar ABC transporter permease YjfF [Ruminococcus sp.]
MTKRIKRMSDTNLLLSITVIVFFLMYISAVLFLGEGFTKPQTFLNLFNNNSYLIIIACGLSMVMITGGIDISVGGVIALVSMTCAVNLDLNGGNLVTSMLIALGIGLAFGLVQGFLIAYLDIQPFIVTLAGMFFARGLTTIVHTDPINVKNSDFVDLRQKLVEIPGLGTTNKKGIEIPATIELGVIVAIVIVIGLFILLRYTKLGRNFYAVGGNQQSALMLGINVKRTKFLSYVFCGLLAGIAGYVYFMHVGSGSNAHAQGAEMNAIASSIIGGTMLTGGVGNIIGTLFGVLSLCTIKDIVASIGLQDAWWTGITVAGMLCIFLLIQSVIMAKKHSAGSTKEQPAEASTS